MIAENNLPARARKWSPVLPAALFLMTVACAERAAERVTPPQVPAAAARVVYAGVRSSKYGVKPFPDPAGWEKAIGAMSGYFPGATPCGVWIVATMARTPRATHVEFPSAGRSYPHVEFDGADRHEPYLTYFDKAGIKVFLQVEPADADMATLIDLVLDRYGRHPCVVGFGVDVEWHRIADSPKTGMAVDDAAARAWEERVKSHNASYRLFLKHWDEKWMPPVYRGDIIFVDDSQIFPDIEAMAREFGEKWAPAFAPNLVVFQIGYNSDKPWWSKLPEPPRTIGQAVLRSVGRDVGIIWVDFSMRDVLPFGGAMTRTRP